MKLRIESMYVNSSNWLKIIPANECLPQWYKDMPTRIDNNSFELRNNPFDGSVDRNITMKGCAPFLDGLTTGYVAVTTNEIQVSKRDGSVLFSWRTPDELISMHSHDQTSTLPQLKGSKDIFKWDIWDRIVTPKGYSTLFTHPMNRHDLPFRTFTGVVETDSYVMPTVFPFQISDDIKEPFILPIGTSTTKSVL